MGPFARKLILAGLGLGAWGASPGAQAPLSTPGFHHLHLNSVNPDAAIEFDPTLVRGMGYYTGTIFEIAHPDFGYSLGGGGRYDYMIGRFLGQEVPACGFSIGFAVRKS